MGYGYFFSKRSLWLMAGGALGTLAVMTIPKAIKTIRPAVVGMVKEVYAFKEWTLAKMEKVKEDIEDIVAEAKHAYHKDFEAGEEIIKKVEVKEVEEA